MVLREPRGVETQPIGGSRLLDCFLDDLPGGLFPIPMLHQNEDPEIHGFLSITADLRFEIHVTKSSYEAGTKRSMDFCEKQRFRQRKGPRFVIHTAAPTDTAQASHLLHRVSRRIAVWK